MFNLAMYEPSYMKMNKLGQVPCLQVGEKFIPDSNAIIRYLDETYPDSKLQFLFNIILH